MQKETIMKQFKKTLALVLALIFVLPAFPVCAAESAAGFEISEFDYGYQGPKDTPLLVILINLDPTLNGENGEKNETMLRQQDHSYWSELFFGDHPKSMKSYFETQSDGRFRFTPALENCVIPEKNNAANDGIVEVSVSTIIDSATKGSTSDPERYAALVAAYTKGYVNYASYDKNGDGTVTEDELVVAFITAGYEYTRNGSDTPSYNAHKSSFSHSIYGTTVSTDYVKCGEMIKNNIPLTVGSFCHEFGHVLGNGDLYNTGNQNWGGANSPAGKVSVMAGHGSAGANTSKGESKGASPSNFDPYHLTVYGLYDYTNVADGTYTLYSRQSSEGKYNILKVSTPNPMEYYLIENRYFDDSSEHFDSETNYEGTRGIIIWHVDQTLADNGRKGAGMVINTKGTNSDIGVAALSPVKVSVDDGGTPHNPASSGVFNKAGLIFNCHDYAFPGSGTWHTGLTAEEAENFNLKIEILDDPDHEMRIKITGAVNASPRYTYVVSNKETSLNIIGQITDLNLQTLTSLRVELSKSEDFSNAISVSLTPTADGRYSHTFENLELGNTYYSRVVLGTKNGEFSKTEKTMFLKPVEEDTTKYNIRFFRGLSAKDKAYTVTVKVGEPAVLKFPMTKAGYVFAGWYLDEEYTKWYDVSVPKHDHEDITLYAKWVEADSAAKLTVKGATLVNEKVDAFAYAGVGDVFREPTVVLNEGETVLWFADAAFTQPFDFTKTVESTEGVTIYAAVLKAGQTIEDLKNSTTESSQTQEPVSSSQNEQQMPENPDESGIEIITVVLIAAVLLAIAAAVFAMCVVLKKKHQ